MLLRNCKSALLSLAVVSLLGAAAINTTAEARERPADRKSKSEKEENRFPNATREEPKAKGSPKLQKKLQGMIEAYNKDDFPAARVRADEVLSNEGASAYDKALAAQIASQATYNTDDTPGSIAYLKQAIELNALDNNSHYQLMYMLAGLELQEDHYAEGLAMLDRYFAETKSQKPEDLVLKGQALYQAERYAEAIPVLKQAIEASPEPKDNWLQLLMASYAEAGQPGEATKLAESIAAKSPTDKKAQFNLANIYLQADQYDKAAMVMEKLRAAGQLTEEKDYRLLYSTYANLDGKEKEVILVVNEGLQKGILKPDQQTYLALAQSYYYSDQIAPAIAAWQKAAPLSKDGETYLNLAKVLWQEDRIPEAKQAAKAALEKGVKKPEDAKKIIALP